MSRRTLVFDVGGVIVRWQPVQLMRAAFPLHAHDDASARVVAAAVFQSFDRGGDWAQFDLGRIEAGPLAERIAERTGLPLSGVEALIAAIPQHIIPMPDSVRLLETVRAAGHRLALLSNMPPAYADHLEAKHACFGWFEARVFSGRIGLIKPDDAMFAHAREAMALDLAHTLFVDDHAGNIDAARAIGWQALHFEDVAQCEAAMRRQGWL